MEQGTHRILQKENKETTVGSVQDFLHKLLRTEATVQERNCCGKERDATSQPRRTIVEHKPNNPPVVKTGATQKDQMKETVTRQGSEMSLKYHKCFNYREKGRLAKVCPKGKKKSDNGRA